VEKIKEGAKKSRKEASLGECRVGECNAGVEYTIEVGVYPIKSRGSNKCFRSSRRM
jgi:hypothetical protein